MRVLHAYNEHRSGGGATKVTQDLVELSRRRGLEVEVLSRSSRDLPAGVRGHLTAGWSAFFGGEGLRSFRELVERFGPDVVHAHELFPLVSPRVLPYAARRGIPIVLTCNDYHLTCPARNHFRENAVCTLCAGGRVLPSVRHLCRGRAVESVTMAAYCAQALPLYLEHVAHFTTPSAFTRRWLVEHLGIPPERITAIEPSVPLPDSAADPGTGDYVAFAGRFVPEKGITTLLDAAQLGGFPLRISRNAVHFVTTSIPANVPVDVTTTRSELESFYRRARVLVVPSLWFETFGLVAAEAMSHGVPVVASRLGALADVVEDGVDGFLFEPGDAADLASKVGRLWNDPDLCRRMGAAGRAKVATLWTEDQAFRRLVGVYEAARRHGESRSRA